MNPIPTGLACEFVDAEIASIDCDEYDNATDGAPPAGAGGNTNGYDQLKSPELPPTCQRPAGFNDAAPKSPANPPVDDVNP